LFIQLSHRIIPLQHTEYIAESTTATEMKRSSGGLSLNARSFHLSLDSLTL